MNKYKNKIQGFTLIELLVVLGIISIIITISSFGVRGAREAARDKRRETDLQEIRAAVELYRADCNQYPASLPSPGNSLVGSGTPASCAAANTYLSTVPEDPATGAAYTYTRTSTTTYTLCATLEDSSSLCVTN
ncbi:hypothetical protein A2801_02815 [Candidatus Woesebacteria bacterium RIFCSPHIGHO2_01_FULL_41_10]|uniref:Type II secretion system protein GspG C-terminal domain-containing protein n=1 Tax=Candidatus Woesebacteria bacterium RIFCSPHIGHO2_01_FULL_41_10 TaxID=1802500 RepID=A0A1F7YQH9_9BACT|nr:MAG: hypothetical protein A2801_02815 [Candidatus Woesebacteria bacterium RIFCSPHIGHO2_01_FULL_41_10]